MATGALQDNTDRGIQADVEISDNPIVPEQLGQEGGYSPIRKFWPNVATRSPENLPAPVTP